MSNHLTYDEALTRIKELDVIVEGREAFIRVLQEEIQEKTACSVSWNGFNAYGDSKTVSEVRSLIDRGAAYQTSLETIRTKDEELKRADADIKNLQRINKESQELAAKRNATIDSQVARINDLEYRISLTPTRNVAPTIHRMWVNQPSKYQPFHALHGKLVLGYEESGEMCRVFPLEGDVLSRQMHSSMLSRGWPMHLRPKPTVKESWRVVVVYKSTAYADETFNFDTEAAAKKYIRAVWEVSEQTDYKEILSTTLESVVA